MRKIAVICLLWLLVCIVVSPVMASVQITAEPLGGTETTYPDVTTLTYDASSKGLGIQRIGVDAPVGTTVTFTIYYGNGSVVTGSTAYTQTFVEPVTGTGFVNSHIVLGSLSSDYTYGGILTNFVGRFYVTGYARNETSTNVYEPGLIIYGGTFGLSTIQNDYVFYPTATGSDSVINKIELSSNNPVDVAIFTKERTSLVADTSKTFLEVVNEWVAFAISLGSTILSVITSLIYWTKFFFIDNLGMTVALYMSVTLVFAARASRGNMARLLRQWFMDQRKFFMFIVELYRLAVEILGTFRGIFRI